MSVHEDIADRGLERGLELLPELYDRLKEVDLTSAVPKMAGASEGGQGVSKPSSRPPLRFDVLCLIDEAHLADVRDPIGDRGVAFTLGTLQLLSQWMRVTGDEYATQGLAWPEMPAELSVTSVCAWLRLCLEPVIERAAWGWMFEDDINTMRARMERSLGIPQPYLPHCGLCGWPVTPVWKGSWWKCTGCLKMFPVVATIKRIGGLQYATLAQIAEELGVKAGTLRQWVARGKLEPAIKTKRGSDLYEIAIVKRMVDMSNLLRDKV